MTFRTRVLPLAVLSILSVAACRRQAEPAPEPEPAQPVATGPSAEDLERARRDSLARAEAARRDSLAAEEARRRQLEEARVALLAPVYFGFDQSELDDRARSVLDSKVPLLRANPELQLRVVGHTDPRGSDEYNLALGARRAAAVARYLEQMGISGSRVTTTSLGEEQPAAPGDTEEAYALDRRAEFDVTAGELRTLGANQ